MPPFLLKTKDNPDGVDGKLFDGGKRSAKMAEGAKLEVIKGAPHGLNATHGDKLTALMLEFLRS